MSRPWHCGERRGALEENVSVSKPFFADHDAVTMRSISSSRPRHRTSPRGDPLIRWPDASAMFLRAFNSSLPNRAPSFASCLVVRRSLLSHQNFALFRMASTLPNLAIFEAIAKHDAESPAIIHSTSQRKFTYGSLLHDVAAAKDHLSKVTNGQPLRGERIAFLAENGYDYVGARRLQGIRW